MQARSEPEVTMSAVKLDRNGNVVETIAFHSVEAEMSPGFIAQLKQAAKEGWKQGQQNKGDE